MNQRYIWTERAICLAVLLVPLLAQAQVGANTGTAAKGYLMNLLQPFFGVALLIFGAACLMGRVNWSWFLAFFVATIMVFGPDQILSMFRGWVGV